MHSKSLGHKGLVTPPHDPSEKRQKGPSIELTAERRFAGIQQRAIVLAAKRLLLEGLRLSAASLSISLVGDDAMRALNLQWRGKDRPTDVLSFPLNAPPSPRQSLPVSATLGDLALCIPQAARQASLRGHSVQEETLILLVHGVLHLCGHDHVHGGRQAGRMRREERRLLRLLSPPGRLLKCLLG